jgi:DNA-binding CsgD family transcriptional regulator/tetratricopeptide (TPR) repeat protein
VTVARRGPNQRIVGRDDEFALLDAAFERVRGGTATTVLVGGEAGIGKTRLVTEFGDRARGTDANALVLTAGCSPLAEGLLPYGPVGDIFRDGAAQLGLPELRDSLGPFAAVLDLVAADLTDGPFPGSETPAPGPLVLGAFRRLATSRPIVAITEDLHWADPSTIDLLVLVCRSLGSARVLCLGTYRTGGFGHGHVVGALPARMERAGAIPLELGPLSREETADQIASILGREAPPEDVDAIVARAEGNPLFTEELLAAGSASAELPAGLRQLLLARVHDLPDAARTLLAAAAVAGRVVDHALLSRVTDLSDDELRDAGRAAVEARVLTPIPGSTAYRFRHALLHEAVASTLLPGDRVHLHRRLAEVLSADPTLGAASGPAASAELAHHWLAAGDLTSALAALVRAGREAEAVHAMAEAHHHFEQALDLWDRVSNAGPIEARAELAEVYEHAAGTACLTGKAARAVALLDRAVARPEIRDDPMTAGLLHERLGHYLWISRADDHVVVAMYERAVARVPAAPSPQRARVLAGLGQILMLLGHYRRSREVCEEALAVAGRVQAHREAGHARNTLGVDLVHLGRLDEGLAHLRQALAEAHDSGTVENLHRAHTNLAATLQAWPMLDEARAIAQEGFEVARRHRLLTTQGAYALSVLAEILYYQGQWDEAEALLSEVTVAAGFPIAQVEVNRVAARLASARGRFEEAERLLDDGEEVAARGDRGTRTRVAATRAEHHMLRGRPERALPDLAAAAADLIPTDEGHILPRLAALGLAAVPAPPPDWLNRLDDLGRQRCGSFPVPPEVTAYLAQARAERARRAGQHDPDLSADVARQWEALGRPYATAWSRLHHAEAAVGAGDRDRATPLIEEVAAVATRLDARPLLGAAANLARRARLPFAAAAAVTGSATGAHGLSAREVEVVGLLAEGRTNRQIADELFISERTAAVHVSHILTKLGVPNRGQAAAVARRLGLVN